MDEESSVRGDPQSLEFDSHPAAHYAPPASLLPLQISGNALPAHTSDDIV